MGKRLLGPSCGADRLSLMVAPLIHALESIGLAQSGMHRACPEWGDLLDVARMQKGLETQASMRAMWGEAQGYLSAAPAATAASQSAAADPIAPAGAGTQERLSG